MPVITAKDNNLYLVDGCCAYEIKRDVQFFIDFEFLYKLMPQNFKQSIMEKHDHCDAVIIKLEEKQDSISITVNLYELSMNEQRGLGEYVRKFEFCMKFIDEFMKWLKIWNRGKGDKKIGGVNFKLFIITNPNVTGSLMKEKGSSYHYRREFFSNYSPELIIESCHQWKDAR
ncbi:hypothetical protein [Sulfurisphaera ohwakuensis]|uniref:hypothetical protein n=1 Tax=Sulfurisphaera ohwakuensis TaxID=69656 RepID=UPI0036F40062